MTRWINSFFKPFFLIVTTAILFATFFSMPAVAKSIDANASQSSIMKSKSLLDDIAVITPTSAAPVTVTSLGATIISYTVTAHAPLQNISIDAGFAMPATLITTTLQSDNCSGKSLNPNASCTFNVALQGVAGQTGSTTVEPRLSANSGAVYVIPSSANRIGVTVNSSASKTLVSITVTPSTGIAGAAVGGTSQFIATGTYSDGSTANITSLVNWTSSNVSFATIGVTTGLATGVAAGTVTITATDSSGKKSGASNFQTLGIGSAFNQGFVYCLGTSGASPCAFLPSGTNPATGAPYAGEVIAATDLFTSGSNSWQKDTSYTGLLWGGYLTAIGASAQSNTNGQSNTLAIYARLTSSATPPSPIQANTYAAGICTIYNSGDNNNTWYLPAKTELLNIYNNRTTLNVALTAAGSSAQVLDTAGTGIAAGVYWSSTEYSSLATDEAWMIDFHSVNAPNDIGKNINGVVRCVRAF